MNNYNSNIKFGIATLNVKNLNKQIDFYTNTMGMTVLDETDDIVLLGTKDNNPLLKLQKTEKKFVHSYGLYHIAYLVPSEQDLANILKHFVTHKTLLDGGADHGYSNAIYLDDAEGNGIEVYYDKDMSYWNIQEDGRIIGITEELDATHLLNISENIIPYELPNGTIIGHIHLTVKDSRESSTFYQNTLNFLDKFTVPNASWIAHGDYHHHLAVNNWAGANLALREKNLPGLAYFELIVTSQKEYANLLKNIKANNTAIISENPNKISILDPNGIEIHLINKN
ncbi:VOC family protein [Gemella cuniculi]|uniref:VOC family protein n=1 Tax=Gemella cuniculi TaxID=150240 RepID=UPI0004034C10|nr:VOC family protein [Gemella cuniculi]